MTSLYSVSVGLVISLILLVAAIACPHPLVVLFVIGIFALLDSMSAKKR